MVDVAEDAQVTPACGSISPPFRADRPADLYYVECPYVVTDARVTLSYFPHYELFADGAAVGKDGVVTVHLPENSAHMLTLEVCDKSSGRNVCTLYRIDVRRKGSSEARLQALSVMAGRKVKLDPDFQPFHFDYSVTVEHKAATVFAEAERGGLVWLGEERPQHPLHILQTKERTPFSARIHVESQDGRAHSTYSLQVKYKKPPPPPAELEALEVNVGDLTPAFSPEIRKYDLYEQQLVSGVAINRFVLWSMVSQLHPLPPNFESRVISCKLSPRSTIY